MLPLSLSELQEQVQKDAYRRKKGFPLPSKAFSIVIRGVVKGQAGVLGPVCTAIKHTHQARQTKPCAFHLQRNWFQVITFYNTFLKEDRPRNQTIPPCQCESLIASFFPKKCFQDVLK
ncbi:protein flightless-1-like protein [Platysternon megacephalum]|uniref:Protein flightless-1-like protein n=1 Tax=Platysternon megacephalum TaxID=55544 RepID=A0A4D9EJN9_9SAUR|nr:protein flightless-1-like protein [Platysternon megacephalum]